MYYINIRNKHWLSLTLGKAEQFEDAERYLEIVKDVTNPEHAWIADERRYVRRDQDNDA